jgi:spore coat protein CotH
VALWAVSLGGTVSGADLPYVNKLFTTDIVHTIDISVDENDWDTMIKDALAEQYIECNVTIDGNTVTGVGIRPKGNSSLSMIANSNSDRYSFKIEFDHYVKGQTYYGLDKLALNNIAQDDTYLKDYVSYRMMNAFGADGPLCSYIYITVNGKEWGLYLAVEGVEKSFAEREYGLDYGNIYKPETSMMDMGGRFGKRSGFPNGGFQGFGSFGGYGNPWGGFPNNGYGDFGGFQGGPPGTGSQAMMPGGGFPANGFSGFQMSGFGFGSDTAVDLIYSGDDIADYSSIFDNAVFSTTKADKTRLIASIKQLNEGMNLAEVVDLDEVTRYFVVHNFVLNFDSYTSSMGHNYYLYEKGGQMSMIAWDYNLAFGGMGGGMFGGFGGKETASGTPDNTTLMVNYPIDTPTSGADIADRPMLAAVLENAANMERYHALFRQFAEDYFDAGNFTDMIDNAIRLIAPYVQKDPTAFCTYEEFQNASLTLREFCLLRAKSVEGQLNGAIASTSDGQAANNYAGFIDASHINISDMGSNSMGFGQAGGGQQQPPAGAGPTQPDGGTGDIDGTSGSYAEPSPPIEKG